MVYICTHSSSAPTLSSASLFFCNRKNFLSLLLRSQIHRISSLLPRIRQIYLSSSGRSGARKRTSRAVCPFIQPFFHRRSRQAFITRNPGRTAASPLMDRIGSAASRRYSSIRLRLKCQRIIIPTSQFRNCFHERHFSLFPGQGRSWRGFTSSTSISSFSRSFSSSATAMRTRIAERPF